VAETEWIRFVAVPPKLDLKSISDMEKKGKLFFFSTVLSRTDKPEDPVSRFRFIVYWWHECAFFFFLRGQEIENSSSDMEIFAMSYSAKCWSMIVFLTIFSD